MAKTTQRIKYGIGDRLWLVSPVRPTIEVEVVSIDDNGIRDNRDYGFLYLVKPENESAFPCSQECLSRSKPGRSK